MNIFAIADLHLSFGVENKEMDKFGDAWKNHHIRLKENWLKVIEPEDLVILPGDLSWGMTLKEALPDLNWIGALPGTKLILKGNHDYWWTSLKKMSVLPESIKVLQNNSYVGNGFAVIGSRGWLCPEDTGFTPEDKKLFDRECLRIRMSADDARAGGAEGLRLIGAMHFPPSVLPDGSGGFTGLWKELGVTDVVYGHLHGENAYKYGPSGIIDGINYHLCSLDRLGCEPQLIARI